MVPVFNPDTPEAEAGESELETNLIYIVSTGQPELCSETLTLKYINRKLFLIAWIWWFVAFVLMMERGGVLPKHFDLYVWKPLQYKGEWIFIWWCANFRTLVIIF